MSNEQLNKIQNYFHWKLEHDLVYIDETNLARYLNISINKASEIFAELYEHKIIKGEVKVECPQCEKAYIIEKSEVDKEILCKECGSEFVPSLNKRLWKYSYLLNKNSQYFSEFSKKDKPKLSIVSKMGIREDIEMDNKRVKVFLSYSHVDEKFKEKLDIHLAPLKRSNKKLEVWQDRELKAGTKFDEEIKKHLKEDDIIILLISADFINSDYCYEVEMKTAFERMEKKEAVVVPVIVRPCYWKKTPLGDIQALPKDGNPISKYQDEDDAYVEIVESISNIIDNFNK